jgi:hypothetical protein
LAALNQSEINRKLGANAVWFRMNVLLYRFLSALKWFGLPAEVHKARPKRVRILRVNLAAPFFWTPTRMKQT